MSASKLTGTTTDGFLTDVDRFAVLHDALGADFVETTIGRRLHHVPASASRGAALSGLLRFVDLTEMIGSRRLEPPQFRVFAGGAEVNQQDYMRPTVTRRNTAYRRLDSAALSRLAAGGATFVIDNVDEMHAPIRDFARQLQWWVGELVQVNAYATFSPSQGFPAHWDDHDVIVVQLAGSKRWRVFGPSREHPMHRDVDHGHTCPSDVLWEHTIETGDIVHIPRGFWHEVVCDGPVSLHLTLGMTRRTGVDWMAWVADELRVDARFRRDLAEGDELPMVDSADLPAANFSVRRFLDHHRDTTVHRHRFDFARIAGVATEMRVVTPFRPRVVVLDRTVDVIAAGHKLTLAAAAAPLVEHLLDGGWHDCSGLAVLAKLPDYSVAGVVEQMSKLGWLEWR